MAGLAANPALSTQHRDVADATIGHELAALERLRANLDESFEVAAETLLSLEGKVITLGVGKSGHAAQKVAATFRSIRTAKRARGRAPGAHSARRAGVR